MYRKTLCRVASTTFSKIQCLCRIKLIINLTNSFRLERRNPCLRLTRFRLFTGTRTVYLVPRWLCNLSDHLSLCLMSLGWMKVQYLYPNLLGCGSESWLWAKQVSCCRSVECENSRVFKCVDKLHSIPCSEYEFWVIFVGEELNVARACAMVSRVIAFQVVFIFDCLSRARFHLLQSKVRLWRTVWIQSHYVAWLFLCLLWVGEGWTRSCLWRTSRNWTRVSRRFGSKKYWNPSIETATVWTKQCKQAPSNSLSNIWCEGRARQNRLVQANLRSEFKYYWSLVQANLSSCEFKYYW